MAFRAGLEAKAAERATAEKSTPLVAKRFHDTNQSFSKDELESFNTHSADRQKTESDTTHSKN